MTAEKNKDKSLIQSIELVVELLSNREYRAARTEILNYNEVDIAEILEEVLENNGVEATIIIFRTLPKDVSVEVFSYLPADDQKAIINGITEKELSYIVDELDFDDKIDLLEELPANLVDKILDQTPKSERSFINVFLNYPPSCAGSLMTPDYITLQENMTVREALDYIKKEGMDSETIYTCYVKSVGRKLRGIVSLRNLVISEDDDKILDLIHEDYVYVNVYDDQEDVAEQFKRYGFLAIPVVDNENRIVGIITVDDIFDVMEEEATEDIERMAGVLAKDSKEYLDIGVFSHAKNRLPWLIFMMISLMITGAIINQFEGMLSKVIVLVSYMPLLSGTGGNTGSQTATLVIRGMAVGNVSTKDAGKVLWKEFRVSVIVGLILSVLNFAKIIFIDGESYVIASAVCVAMIAIIIFAKVVGGMLPIGAKKIGIDPALMANPMIASITDMVSVIAYFLIASAFLQL